MNLSYIAGFVDGEGCVQFTKCRSSIYPRVLVTNTNRSVLEKLQSKFGGDIKALSLRKDNWKQGWTWRISWSKAVNFLSKIYPWLEIKKEQCQIIFLWDKIRLRSGNVSIEKRNNYLRSINLLMLRMKLINKKGESEVVSNGKMWW